MKGTSAFNLGINNYFFYNEHLSHLCIDKCIKAVFKPIVAREAYKIEIHMKQLKFVYLVALIPSLLLSESLFNEIKFVSITIDQNMKTVAIIITRSDLCRTA